MATSNDLRKDDGKGRKPHDESRQNGNLYRREELLLLLLPATSSSVAH
jgi:hypothetical protein